MPLNKIIIVLILLIPLTLFSQDGKSFEGGFMSGLSSYQTDYGQRYEIKSGVTGNLGVVASGVMYMNFFDYQITWWNKGQWVPMHLKLKAEASYTKGNLQHYGAYVKENSLTAEKLRAMHGSLSMFNIGFSTEYHFNDLTYAYHVNAPKINPYIGIGSMLVFSNPTFTSDRGDYLVDPTVLPEKYQVDAIFPDKEITGSAFISLGSRFRGGDLGYFIVESRWHYFFSNHVDALDPKDDSNKFNDWMFQFQAGFSFYIWAFE